jgi:hypothetical protein
VETRLIVEQGTLSPLGIHGDRLMLWPGFQSRQSIIHSNFLVVSVYWNDVALRTSLTSSSWEPRVGILEHVFNRLESSSFLWHNLIWKVSLDIRDLRILDRIRTEIRFLLITQTLPHK